MLDSIINQAFIQSFASLHLSFNHHLLNSLYSQYHIQIYAMALILFFLFEFIKHDYFKECWQLIDFYANEALLQACAKTE